MPEETPAVEETTQEPEESGSPQETPAEDSQESSPQTDWESDDNPYRKRYEDLRPVYDQTQNIVAALQDPERQADVLRHFGIELEDVEEDPDFDPEEPLTRAEFEQFLSQNQEAQQAYQDQEQALDEDAEFATESIAALEKEHGKFSEPELDALLSLAVQMRDEEGQLGLEKAHGLLSNVFEERQSRYLKSKKGSQVPVGEAGEAKIDVADDEARTQALASMLEAGRDD